jgi:hypothetical protein
MNLVTDQLQPATTGTGPLLQRDYWAVLAECSLSPSALMQKVKAHFCELPPTALVEFAAPDGVALNTELDIVIRPGQDCRVRVLHEDAQSLTLGTLEGHPEAGRITFGAYRNPAGAVIFHIRSRARSKDAPRLLGFLAIGEAMQTDTWTDFINNTAALACARIDGPIRASTEEVEVDVDDECDVPAPTFRAVGD